MDLKNKHIFFAVSSMGLGHIHRSLPIIKYLLTAGSRLTLLSHGRALETLRLELAEFSGIEYLAYKDYPPIQRGQGFAHYACFIKDLLETGNRIKKETTLLKTLLSERKIDLIFTDGRFGFADKEIPSFLVCHQIRFILPRWLRIFQFLSDLGQYLLLRKFTRIIVPDLADPDINLAGKLSHNWMSKKLNTIYVGFLSSLKKTAASKTIDIVFITGGFIEEERKKIENWAKRHLPGLAHKVVLVTGRKDEGLKTDSQLETYPCAFGEKRNELLNSTRILVGRTGYTTIMDICELGLNAALTPTPYMTEQESLAERIAHWKHPLPVDINSKSELVWVGIDGNALPPSIRNWSTEKSVKCLADFLAEFDHE